MSKEKTKDELLKHKENAISIIDSCITEMINSDSTKGKADKLCYWLEDWSTYLDYEPNFSPRSLRKYKRGEIIKLHLGFNVGSEEGGLHYAIVLDKKNSVNSPILTVIPLTSVKQNTRLDRLHKGNVYLGNELFTSLNSKLSSLHRSTVAEIRDLTLLTKEVNKQNADTDEVNAILSRINKAKENVKLINKIKNEVDKMKRGSIALVGQIRTISKIRIYDPKTNMDVLSNIKLSNEKLDLIDEAIKFLYIK